MDAIRASIDIYVGADGKMARAVVKLSNLERDLCFATINCTHYKYNEYGGVLELFSDNEYKDKIAHIIGIATYSARIVKANFYFTYGDAPGVFPFEGGWSRIVANTLEDAIKKHVSKYGYTEDNFLRCAGIYTEERFRETVMYTIGSNRDMGEHEVIE